MLDGHCHDSSRSKLVPAVYSELDPEETFSSVSEDEEAHRSYIQSDAAPTEAPSLKQSKNWFKGTLLYMLLRRGSKNKDNQEEKSQGQKSARSKSLDATSTSKTNGQVSGMESSGVYRGRRSVPEVFIYGSGVRDAQSVTPQRLDKSSLGSVSVVGHNQKSYQSTLSDSRLGSHGKEVTTKRTVRVIMLGDPGVGKSTFLQTLVKGEFVPSNKMSNIMASHTTVHLTHGKHNVELEIQDTAGQERFRSLTASYYRHAHGCLVFFNVHDKDSFSSVADWLEDIRMYHNNAINPAVVLVGLLHRPPRDRASFRRRNSLRGDDVRSVAANYLSSSPRDSGNSFLSPNDSSNVKYGSDLDIPSLYPSEQQQQQLQKEDHEPQTQYRRQTSMDRRSPSMVPPVLVEPPREGQMREIPFEQADHMASHWGIPYREVDTRGDYDSVLEAISSLLDLAIPDLARITHQRLNSIVPPSSRKVSLNWSEDNHDGVGSFACCLHC